MYRSITSYIGRYYRVINNSFNRTFHTKINKMKIGTHDGVFHCDEVLACYMLTLLPDYKDAEIIRTRDKTKLAECDLVVDVGAEFSHEMKRYDHHQAGFTHTLSSLKPELGDDYKIKLSSAGLIYAFYGESIIQTLTSQSLSPKELKTAYKKIYENFIQEIDGIDNGIPMTEEKPKYRIRTDLSSRVGRLNPDWNTKQEYDLDEIFRKAMVLVSEEFLFVVNHTLTIWLPARQYVMQSLDKRYTIHKSGKILEFTERFPWKEHLFEIEKELGLEQEISYVVFNDKEDSWRVQAVPVEPASFILRKPLHQLWRGIRDEDLSELAGIENCIFCHSNGFIGGSKTREGAIAMAVKSLEA